MVRTACSAFICCFCLLFIVGCAGEQPPATGDTAEQSPPPAAPSPAASAATYDVEQSRNLVEAAVTGDADCAREALLAGADPDIRHSDGYSALMAAAYDGHTAVAALLLDHGAKVDPRDPAGRTALMYASSGPFAETVELLLEHGADPLAVDQEEHFTPLMFAASEGQAEVVLLLLEHGSDPSMMDVDGDTALSFATQHGHTAVVELLNNLGS